MPRQRVWHSGIRAGHPQKQRGPEIPRPLSRSSIPDPSTQIGHAAAPVKRADRTLLNAQDHGAVWGLRRFEMGPHRLHISLRSWGYYSDIQSEILVFLESIVLVSIIWHYSTIQQYTILTVKIYLIILNILIKNFAIFRT